MVSRALREIGPEEMTDEDLAEIMPAIDQITLVLQKIARRKEREQARRITIYQPTTRVGPKYRPTTPSAQYTCGHPRRLQASD
jgi:hypothetical protein